MTIKSLESNLNQLVLEHKIWDNPLLEMFDKGVLTEKECAIFFGQYSLYSANFTRILSSILHHTTDSEVRRVIIQNLWEEIGENDSSKSHAILFNSFLERLNIKRDELYYLPSTKYFVDWHSEIGTTLGYQASMSILAYATEGIVPRLYSIFLNGLQSCGLTKEELTFFTLHIDCDVGHSDNIIASLNLESLTPKKQQECYNAVNLALNMRDQFFHEMYKFIVFQATNHISESIIGLNFSENSSNYKEVLKSNITCNPLYKNHSLCDDTNFNVSRINVPASVLDPRILTIAIGSHNELHKHAHETLFYVLSGTAIVHIQDEHIKIGKGEFMYVPRWKNHQTYNCGDEELKILAITDYGLTRNFPGNSEKSYRVLK